MKIILKKNGSFFVWAVLPVLFLLTSVATVQLISKKAETAVPDTCNAAPVTCPPDPANPQCPDGSIERRGDEQCNSNRSNRCLIERCESSRCSQGTTTITDNSILECHCGNGVVDAGEPCDPRSTMVNLPANSYCDSACAIQTVPSAPPAVSPPCGNGVIDVGESCDTALTPSGYYVNPSSGKEEGSCVSCQCMPWMLEGGGGSGGTKCSFNPAALFSLSGILTQLGLISLVPVVIACCRNRKKK